MFYVPHTDKVVRRDQYKPLPMDQGMINRMNDISRAKGGVPKKLSSLEEADASEPLEDVPTRVVPRGQAPFADFTHPTAPVEPEEPVILDFVRAGDVIPNAGVILRDEDDIVGGDNMGEDMGDAVAGNDMGAFEEVPHPAGVDTARYHHPTAAPGESGAADTPWFLKGAPLPSGDGRARRVTKQPERLTYDSFWAEAGALGVQQPGQWTQRSVPLGSRVPRRPRGHRARETRREKHETAFHISVMKAVQEYGQEATDSILKELTSVHEKGVFKQVRYKDLTPKERKAIIRSSMFLKQKFLSTGVFERLKARLVAGGHLQDRSEYADSERSAPTVSLQSLYLVAAIAAHERRVVKVMDVGTAYLNAGMKKTVLMKVDKVLSKYLLKVDSNYTLEDDDTIIVRLEKALYGCLESAQLWNEMLTKTLMRLGFKCNERDPCVFNTVREGRQVTVCVYVDDLFCTSANEGDCEWVHDELVKEYKEVSISSGKSTHILVRHLTSRCRAKSR